jgi:hypothetical protein
MGVLNPKLGYFQDLEQLVCDGPILTIELDETVKTSKASSFGIWG